MTHPGDLYVSLEGSDGWTGLVPEANADRTDGPLASVSAAKRIVFDMIRRGMVKRRITVWIRGGRYPLRSPLAFDAYESGEVTFASYPGEEAIFDGGARITDWRACEVHGRTAWSADVSAILESLRDMPFRSLFVNGERRARTRLPKAGMFGIAGTGAAQEAGIFAGARTFTAREDDFGHFRNLNDVEVVVLHAWVEERMPVRSYDPVTRSVSCSRSSLMGLSKGTQYYVENAFEAMTEPGDWYLDRPSKTLFYIPNEGETLGSCEVVVPVVLQFLRVTGDLEMNGAATVTGLRFERLRFEYSDWVQPEAWCDWYDPATPRSSWHLRDSARHFIKNDGGDPGDEKASNPQGAYNVPGVLHFEAAQNCSVEDCRIAHIGFYGIDLREGCTGFRLIGNTITDMGAGGIKTDGGGPQSAVHRRNGKHRITDNTIQAGGRVFTSAMGVISMFSDMNIIAHNHISDLYQSGISIGWRWDYEEQVARDHLVEKNLVHTLGQGVLSDMGGIYTLGVLSGTTIRGNLIYDMQSGGYGACGIYLDGASSNLLIEGNIVHSVGESVSMNRGRSNIFRCNIFAHALKHGVYLGREPHKPWLDYPRKGVRFEHNIFLLQGEPVFVDHERFIEEDILVSDSNVFWDEAGSCPLVYRFAPWRGGALAHNPGKAPEDEGDPRIRLFDLPSWQETGHDSHSIVADPQVTLEADGSLKLSQGSPARALGFVPETMSDLGPRPPDLRE